MTKIQSKQRPGFADESVLSCGGASLDRSISFGRRQNAPENATHPKTQAFDHFKNLRFRVCCSFGRVFGALLKGNKEHPKTQHTRKRRFSEWSSTFGHF